METLRLEVEDLKKELTKYDDQLAAVDEAITGFEEKVKEVEEKAKETKVCNGRLKTKMRFLHRHHWIFLAAVLVGCDNLLTDFH